MSTRHADVLLVGGGVAAARCARTLRRNGFGGSILLVGDEMLPPYNRPPLSKELLRDDLPVDLLLAEPRSWYERRSVELALGTPVSSLDPAERVAELADGSRVGYDDCLLATGAETRLPPVPGVQHAMLLRTADDSLALRARAVAGRRAVIVGGGFIGVEVAASLAARGLAVTVVEASGRLWAGSLGGTVSAWGAGRLVEAGVEVRVRASCTAVEPDGVLVGAERLAADLVVAGVGVTPRTRLADDAGLEVDDGIVVDGLQRTSAAGVFAAGDAGRPRDGVRVEHWHAAREAGERAALAMLDLPVPPAPPAWVYSDFGSAHLDVIGLAGTGDEELRLAPGIVGWVRDGRLTQVALMDHALPIEDVRARMASAPTSEELVSGT